MRTSHENAARKDSQEFNDGPAQERADGMLQTELETMMQTAFRSKEELLRLPVELRAATANAARYVTQVIGNELGDDVYIDEAEARRIATQFLDHLSAAEAEKEVWEGVGARDDVVKALQQSLMMNKIRPENITDFIASISSLIRSGSSHVDIGTLLMKHHQELQSSEDPLVQVQYQQLLRNPEVIMRLGYIYTDDQGMLDGDRIDEGYMLYSDLLSNLGFEHIQDCLRGWGMSPAHSIRRIGELEKERPGSATLLNNFYGIRNFGRHLPDALLSQYDAHFDTTGKEYGVTFGAVEDKEKAFANGWRDLASFNSSVVKCPVRAIEAGTKQESDERFAMLGERFGEKKIAFLYASSHGDGDSLILDGEYRITIQDDLTTFRKSFIDHPLIVLGACSAGKEGGIAQYMSAQLEATVVAPASDAAVKNLVVKEYEAGLRIIPEFATGNSFEGETEVPVEAVLYEMGHRIPQTDERYIAYFQAPAA